MDLGDLPVRPFRITEKESESQLVLEPEKDTGPVFPRDGQPWAPAGRGEAESGGPQQRGGWRAGD